MTDERAQKLLRDIPSELKDALVAQAEFDGTNMNDVAVSILAEAYGVPFTPSEKRTPGLTDALDISIQMPKRLRRKLNIEAARQETTATDLILAELLGYFRIDAAA